MYFRKTRVSENRRLGRLNSIMNAMDVHSYAQPHAVCVRHLDLDLRVDFDRRILDGAATIHYDRLAPGDLILDTRGLSIHSVENAASFDLGPADPILGAPLRIRLRNDDPVRVHYSTSPAASALQWLDPA